MKNDIKLIAFDLDGTFLDDDKKVPEKNIQAVKAAVERGIICMPATGRLARGIPKPVFDLPELRYILASNGASLYDLKTEQAIYKADMALQTALRLCDYMDRLPVIYSCFQFERGYMNRVLHDKIPEFLGHAPVINEYVQSINRPIASVHGMLEKRGQPVEKMIMFYRQEELRLRAEQLEHMPKAFPELKISSSLPFNIEINDGDADKGRALSALCAHLGIAKENVVCFGDASNDITMLNAAGIGIAMSNGANSAKAAADMCTESDNNHGGVGEMIMKLIG